eukprot:180934-Rhodomonas_salina.1
MMPFVSVSSTDDAYLSLPGTDGGCLSRCLAHTVLPRGYQLSHPSVPPPHHHPLLTFGLLGGGSPAFSRLTLIAITLTLITRALTHKAADSSSPQTFPLQSTRATGGSTPRTWSRGPQVTCGPVITCAAALR